MSLILLVIPCTTVLESPKKVERDTKSSIELNTGVPVTIHLIWVWRRHTLLNNLDFLLRISWASSRMTRSHCTIWRGVFASALPPFVVSSVYGASVTSASLILLSGPSKILIVRLGANRLISSDHWVIIDFGTMIRVRGFGFPSMVAINWMVFPSPGSSINIPAFGPDTCCSWLSIQRTPSRW